MNLMAQCTDHIEEKRRLAEQLCRMLAFSDVEEYTSSAGYRFLKIDKLKGRKARRRK